MPDTTTQTAYLAGGCFWGFVGIACGMYLLLRDGVKFGKLALRQPAFSEALIITPSPSFHRTLHIKPRKAGEFKR